MTKPIIAYTHTNRFGQWSIRLQPSGRWQAMLDDEPLGSYHTAAAAHDDLIHGATFTPASGVDPGSCSLPPELADWTRVHGH